MMILKGYVSYVACGTLENSSPDTSIPETSLSRIFSAHFDVNLYIMLRICYKYKSHTVIT